MHITHIMADRLFKLNYFLSKSITLPKCILVYRVEFQLFSTISSRSHGNVMLYIDMLI